ncbi:ABC transporter permease [Patescibacteria group bacterium]|nr:ABC transporter permease [Patescibacteria group bacterium]
MFLLTLFRLTKLGIVNFYRNLWLSLIATFVMSLTLMTITFLLVSAFVINVEIEGVKNRIDYEIYIEDNVSTDDMTRLEESIRNVVEVKEIRNVSKEEAVKRYKEIFGDTENLLTYIEQENPLKASIIVKTAKPEDLEYIENLVESDDFEDIVYSSSYSRNKQIITRLIGIIDFIEKAGVVVGIIFVIIAVAVVFSIVRVTIYSRKDEIEIMKLVGATDWFVHGPFIIESALYGVLAAFVAFGLLAAIFYYVSIAATSYLDLSPNAFSDYLNQYFWFIVIFQLLLGVTISVLSGFVAIRKHL